MHAALRRAIGIVIGIALAAVGAAPHAHAQNAQRRLTTIDALRQFPGYFHLQNVLLRGEFSESGLRVVLRSDAHEMGVALADGVTPVSGRVDVRGQLIDVGRLESGDPRGSIPGQTRSTDQWPRPGEELFLRVTGVTPSPDVAPVVSVRGLALEPWRYAGQVVTVVGNFRGRNLFGDLPDAPTKGRYDFVIRATDGAVWVTGLQPRGRGFDLDVDRRLDTSRWVEVTGTVAHDRGLVRIEGTRVATTAAPTSTAASDEPPTPAAPPPPVDVVFASPSEGETDVAPSATVRVQFSKGLAEPTVAGRVTAGYAGVADGAPGSTLAVRTAYDAASRSLVITFTEPLEPLRTVVVRLLDGITAFDRGPLAPWRVTFSVGSR